MPLVDDLSQHPCTDCIVPPPLQLAKTNLDSLNKLLEAYGKIASSISGLRRYKHIFEKHEPLELVLGDYYSDILTFHQQALEVFGRSSKSLPSQNLPLKPTQL